MRRLAPTLTLTLAVLAAAGCGGGASTGSESTATVSSTGVSVAPSDSPTCASRPVSPNATPTSASFDRRFTWPDDGLAILVTAPTEFTPSPDADVGDFPSFVEIHVSVVAGRSECTAFDFGEFGATVRSGGADGAEVFDPENDFVGTPVVSLTRGREKSFRLGFGVKDPTDVVLEVVRDSEHGSVIFTR